MTHPTVSHPDATTPTTSRKKSAVKMASGGREGSCTAASMRKASLALHLVLFAVTTSCASAFGVLPTARTTVLGTTVTSSKFNFRRATGHGILSARASDAIAEKKIDEDGSGSTSLAVAVVGAGGATASNAVAASVKSRAASGTIQMIQVDAAFDPAIDAAFDQAAAAKEATRTRAQAVTRRAAKSVARSLPGTWWAAGLPKWMHLVRRRMITKEDWMHVHAASGAVSKDFFAKWKQTHLPVVLERARDAVRHPPPSPPCLLPPLPSLGS